MPRLRLAIFLVISSFAMYGCEQTDNSNAINSLPASVPGNGIVRGTIKFIGAAPTMKTFLATESCCAGDPPLVEETVIVNPNSTLRNVFVYLEGAPKTNGVQLPAATLDQVHCRYAPHALGLQLGQTLKLRSSDPTMHNVHYIPTLNPPHNYAMTQVNEEYQTKFTAGPEFIRHEMRCPPVDDGVGGCIRESVFTLSPMTKGPIRSKESPPEPTSWSPGMNCTAGRSGN